MPILILLIAVVVGGAIAAYVTTVDTVPPWVKMLFNVLLAIAIIIAIVFGIYVISGIVAHI